MVRKGEIVNIIYIAFSCSLLRKMLTAKVGLFSFAYNAFKLASVHNDARSVTTISSAKRKEKRIRKKKKKEKGSSKNKWKVS